MAPQGIFQWSMVKGDAELQANVKVEKKVKEWNDRLVVVCRNYVLVYPAASDVTKIKGDTVPKQFLRLDKCSLQTISVREELSGLWPKKEVVQFCFSVTRDDDAQQSVIIKCANADEYKQWFGDLYERIPRLKKEARELHAFGKGMAEVTKLIQKPIRVETMTKPDRAKDWVAMMADYHAHYDKWQPIMKMMVHFSELLHDKTRAYMEWFSEAGGGLARDLSTAEDAQLENWRKKFMDIEEVKEKISKATEVSFFREDFEPTVAFCQGNLTILELYNDYKSRVLHQGNGTEFDAMATKLKALIKFLQAFPSSDEVNMDEGFNKAQLKVGNQNWLFERMPEGHIEFRALKTPEMFPFFNVSGFQIVSESYGTVLWNKTSWVWYHPNLPFTLRYNFKKADNLFSFHGIKGEPKKGQHAVLPSWKWNGTTGLQPVLSKEAELDPQIKPQFASVISQGDMPLPCMLLGAMMAHIRYITFTALGYE